MSIFKCKMCGGTLEINRETVATCEYCGTQQTLPKLDDDRKANLYDRANHFRRNNEFDKAMGIYEQILNDDNTDAESYWSLVLCRYGIEYVEDPATHKRVPTVNRAQFTSIYDDDNYKSAIKYADGAQRHLYEEEAKAINEIQKGILAISQKEEPFDVFICYKETDKNGRRTPDSVLANELYHQLTQEGFKVFFSRITLEDKLGVAYEPYIFAALNSAKVMVVLGTKPEYFNAVWVKNEWSRYLAMIKGGAKKILIPAYRDMDPYDLPEEFSHLQAQDMGKLGFMQDLIRGIKKIAQTEEPKQTIVTETVVTPINASNAPLLKRAFMFLEDGDWKSADEYCEKVLDIDPECAEAYLGKLMAELHVRKQDDLKDCENPFDDRNNYQKTIRFADTALREILSGCINHIKERNKKDLLERYYQMCIEEMAVSVDEAHFKNAAEHFNNISTYKDSADLAQQCMEKAENARKDAIYEGAKKLMTGSQIANFQDALKSFETIRGWKDADEQIAACQSKIVEIEAKKERERVEAKVRAKKNKKIAMIVTPIVCAVIVFVIILNTVIIPNIKYNKAVALMDAGMHMDAMNYFVQIDGYKDSEIHIQTFWNQIAVRETISAGLHHTVGLKTDGTVVTTKIPNSVFWNKGQGNVGGWKDIVAISAGEYHTVGLKADGTVLAVGPNSYGECDVGGWKGIVAISAGEYHTVGLKADGTVVAVGSNGHGQCDVGGWKDIVAISAGGSNTVGLKADGTVVAVGYNKYSQCYYVSGWKDIVAISINSYHAVGLKADGTVVAVGDNHYGQRDVGGWKDIVAISAGDWFTVGLKADGTVVAVGNNRNGECNVSGWKNIVAISVGSSHTIGLKADGTVVAVGYDDYGLDVSGWKNIKLPTYRYSDSP